MQNYYHAQLQGPRDYQEDRICVLELTLPSAAPDQNGCEQFLHQVIGSLHQSTFALNEDHCGSTCTIALLLPDNRFFIGWLGDSPALLLSPHGCDLLTREHIPGCDPVFQVTADNCEDVQGFQRVRSLHPVGEEEGDPIYQKLAVSRALGDNDFPLIRTPDVMRGNLTPGNMLAIASDGINTIMNYDGHFKSDAGINLDYAGDNPAEYLADRAHLNRPYKKGDNISVITLPFAADRSSILLAAVFDGHGGDRVADFAAQQLRVIVQPLWQKIFFGKTFILPEY
ncbi:MAG TPA: hypothetical protein PKW15_04675 [Alphaproteobacteria bacterium]|nr:hypothetical protein [Alphaproteobacteria bacterium]